MAKSLGDPITVLKGVGEKRAEALSSLGLNTINDLLTYYPFRYEDMAAKKLSEITDQEKVTIAGTVASEPIVVHFGRKKNRLNFRLLVDHDVVNVTFFNQPWLKNQIETGQTIGVYGRFDRKRLGLSGMKVIKVDQSKDELDSIYPTNKAIRQSSIKQLVTDAFNDYQDILTDVVPAPIQQKYRLLDQHTMIHDMHFPVTAEAARQARRSAKFEEFFLFQMRLQLLKKTDQDQYGNAITFIPDELQTFIHSLPYKLTNAQKRVVNEICLDLKRPIHMNRLLQGDVGSGKTVVAAIAMYAAMTAGYQTALMAPTEILAEQHANNLAKLFEGFPVAITLLTGSTKQKARNLLLPRLADGSINIIVGTHALIQDEVIFKNLGLAVIDEQHRFGVKQRTALREKGQFPDVLAMTATPIPRTLAITAYGEMDVSVIDELPANRKPIKTTWIKSNQVDNAMDFVKEQLRGGSQAYVVTPLIEESEAVDMRNATEIFERFQNDFSPEFKVGLLHGRMKNDEKNEIMTAFKNNEFQVLVATTVIEVGIDVPNATVMMIFDADHFGLAQLHQLRGRVGRGEKASECILVADPKNQLAIERMTVMTETNDGFIISQKDLELRGSGDVLGTNQSGLPNFKVGDPVADLTMLSIAQQEAIQLVSTENWEDKPENVTLAHYLSVAAQLPQTLD